MTFEEMIAAVRVRFKTEVADPEGLAVAWDNAPFDPTPGTLWVHPTVLPGESEQVSMGRSKRFRTVGVLAVQIFAPLATGEQAAYELADKITAAFRAVSADGVKYRTPSVHRVGRSRNWWQLNVNCPFYADDIAQS